MGLRKIFLVTIFATITLASPFPRPSPRPQQQHQQQVEEVYEAYVPGQYTFQSPQAQAQAQPQFIRVAGPRLAGPRNGAPVLRAVPRRIRINNNPNPNIQQQQQQFVLPQQTYAIDTPVTPITTTYAQGTPALPQQTYLRAAPQQQEPAYYIQRTPAPSQIIQQQQPRFIATPRPAVRINKAPLAALQPQRFAQPQSSSNNNENEEEYEDEYPADPNPQYNFAFDVKDDELTNYQNRQEERDGQTIKGSYSVVDPDGYVRTVTYTADPKNGFQAKVTREPTDVKVKFPVPTEAPEEQAAAIKQQPFRHGTAVVPSIRAQQFAQYPQTVSQYSQQQQPATNLYTQQQLASGAYYTNGQQPTYIVRRVPASSLNSSSSPRLVKVLRQ